ncbi:leucine-rich repeat extensin-like protein 7 [Iris pallida]|uniref:Leucine-rich repeat extensin-like protein 7 n=1 Tax=Iris pallida TaxID=29817 RepID=A0AAX6H2Z9_IRIPA|nr:leucine-rich repeat extensin-like protein 7 [Iris pallida]
MRAQARTHAHAWASVARRHVAVRAAVGPWPCSPAMGEPPLTTTVLRDAPSRRFVRFGRDPVGAREFRTQIWRSVAATSHAFFRRSDRWIGDFFTPSQSRFAGPTSSACISSTAAPFGVLPVPGRSWTLWLQWDLPFTYQLFRLSRRIAWRCLLA